MLTRGIINPAVLELLARVRHTNTLVICDMGFPVYPAVQTIDLSIQANLPTVLQVFNAIKAQYEIGQVWMAAEFTTHNEPIVLDQFSSALGSIPRVFEPHTIMKERIPGAIGIIRTGDTTRYGNMVLLSADNNAS